MRYKDTTHRDRLSSKNRVMMRVDKLAILKSLRVAVKEHIHRGHQGIDEHIARAQISVWWPKLIGSFKEFVEKCEECIENIPVGHQLLRSSVLLEVAWECAGSDLYEF